ncbi:hypothetical protein HYC85_008710 [Camellia sinensis]|uniref:NAD-dependent epimerase/dehydratase domain-containing protein n=1 Tax=Camellia sinensis TaxID=4442 RepID=A0A7J7HUV5_CAMSI|nr:hypothetical protein HYC85_008710 [Camellia sinensis]
MAEEKGTVCVTGAGGYVASWLVKLLLSNGYSIHGTVRDPHDEKNSHLKKLEKASEKLKLFKVDLLDYNSLSAAITGCVGVQLIEPAVKGTLNVLKACSEANVKRVVVVSSGAAVSLNPEWPKGQVKDETCWSDAEYCRRTNNWYCLSKTKAESEAFEYAKRSGLDVVRVCPTHVLGPMLQSTANASSLVLIKLSKDIDVTIQRHTISTIALFMGYDEFENNLRMIVDVRDVAEALLLAYEKPEAEGRYICTAYMIKSQDLVEILRKNYPNYNYPKKFTEGKEEEKLSSEKLQKLGWSYRPMEETLVDSIESCRQAGLLIYKLYHQAFSYPEPLCSIDVVLGIVVQLIEPAVKGTLNVLKACSEANVKRVVVVSSGAAVSLNPEWPKGQNWYCLSKTKAESEALEFAKRSGLDVVRVCPTHVLGPMLQSAVNANLLRERKKKSSVQRNCRSWVGVTDR